MICTLSKSANASEQNIQTRAAFCFHRGTDLYDLIQDSLEAPENQIGLTAAARLLHAGVVRTGCEHFALTVGQRTRLSQLGLPKGPDSKPAPRSATAVYSAD